MTCSTCKHFNRYDPEVSMFGKEKQSDSGACHRYPPVPVGAGSVSAQGVHGFAKSCWPDVHQDALCGEWSAL